MISPQQEIHTDLTMGNKILLTKEIMQADRDLFTM